MHATVCLNCDSRLDGRYCRSCGQRDDAGHRSLRHLAAEAAEAFTHADSRLWRTLWQLFRHPGRLTSEYLAGRRAAQIPPLRLFLVTMLLLFGVASLTAGHFTIVHMTAAEHRDAQAAIGAIALPRHPWLQSWLRGHLVAALDRPDGVVETMREWAERVTVLMLPAASLMLWVLYAPARGPDGRRHTLFDHLVFSMHSLSATGMVLSVQFVLRTIATHVDPLLLALPIHLFAHLRGTYGSGVPGTLVRMAVLFAGSLLVLVLMAVALAALGLQIGTRHA